MSKVDWLIAVGCCRRYYDLMFVFVYVSVSVFIRFNFLSFVWLLWCCGTSSIFCSFLLSGQMFSAIKSLFGWFFISISVFFATLRATNIYLCGHLKHSLAAYQIPSLNRKKSIQILIGRNGTGPFFCLPPLSIHKSVHSTHIYVIIKWCII